MIYILKTLLRVKIHIFNKHAYFYSRFLNEYIFSFFFFFFTKNALVDLGRGTPAHSEDIQMPFSRTILRRTLKTRNNDLSAILSHMVTSFISDARISRSNFIRHERFDFIGYRVLQFYSDNSTNLVHDINAFVRD